MTLRLKMFQHFTSCLWSQSPFIYFYYILKSLHLFESVTAASCGIDLFAVLYCAGLKVNQQTLAQENWQDGVVLNTGQCLLFLRALISFRTAAGQDLGFLLHLVQSPSVATLVYWIGYKCHVIQCHTNVMSTTPSFGSSEEGLCT